MPGISGALGAPLHKGRAKWIWTAILVVDGQGGRIGQSLIEEVRRRQLPLRITAIGTNATATRRDAESRAQTGGLPGKIP